MWNIGISRLSTNSKPVQPPRSDCSTVTYLGSVLRWISDQSVAPCGLGGPLIVPAVMLLLPSVAHTLAGPTLALVSTLAGNLLIVGSVANIIVVDAAGRRGIAISWREHARIGIPVTLVTLTIVAFYLALRWAAAR